MKTTNEPSSYRDPSGFIFYDNERVLRQINPSYRLDYQTLLNSGLYKALVSKKFLVSHTDVTHDYPKLRAYKIIEPTKIPFISYPYEWCFSQLKDAALLTLRVQKMSLEYGMTLKDASGFNIQYLEGKPICIDTLSFTTYHEGSPWIAYKQFCEHFLAPIALASYTDIRTEKLTRLYLDGIPLDLASSLLPLKARMNPSILIHIFLHARQQKKYASTLLTESTSRVFTKQSFLALIDNLESCIQSLRWNPEQTVWTDYATQPISYKDEAHLTKKQTVAAYLKKSNPSSVWDIGANTGDFSRLASDLGIFTVSMDFDPTVVEQNYLRVKQTKEAHLLPLWIDITNPTPSLGWGNIERYSLLNRPHPDTILALALIHHLAIAYNIPFNYLSHFFSKLCTTLIIEFIPKEDKQVQILLQNREDIFPNYTQSEFERSFKEFFTIQDQANLPDSHRTLYLMKKKISV